VPVAYVVRRAGVAADAETLKRHVAEHLARFKVPRDIIFVDSLPKNALGKVQHFRLREESLKNILS
jgi:fatty-acyl-CoA synthase